jgi:hypothetical protein
VRPLLALVLGLLAVAGPGAAWDGREVFECFAGFEDRAGRDYDYNDFGMAVRVEESRDPAGRLRRVEMHFEARCRLAGDAHDIHAARSFAASTRYRWTLARSRPALGAEAPATTGPVAGSGPVEVLIFDSARTRPGERVSVVVEVVEDGEPAPAPRGPADLAADPLPPEYDLWLFNRVQATERRRGERQPYFDRDFEVPFVLHVPDPDWEPPPEGVPVGRLHPDFERFHETGDPGLARWFE